MRFDFSDGKRLGPGKIALLEALAATGSIAAAGRRHGMAYRRAWLLVDEMNHMFKQPVVVAKGGGKAGGGAALTAFGARLVAHYRDAEAKAAEVAQATIELFEAERAAQPQPGMT
ncbi:MAG: LysR family transcriptional regulator [Hyphomicrobiales bacterium]|nr:LysR family transcriptional regulator [Hyphomicrobiales bacterium]